jgi:hypothetical protein
MTDGVFAFVYPKEFITDSEISKIVVKTERFI